MGCNPRRTSTASCGSARAAARSRSRRRGRCASAWPRRMGFAPDGIELEVIRTTGDTIQDRPLAEVGGKGLFTKEIEEALLAGAIDLAVHSAKDMPTVLPPGLLIAAVLPREDAARRLHQPQGEDAARSAARARWSAPRRCAGRRWSSGCGPTSRSCRCAAMSRRACASSTTARSTRRCSRSPGLKRLGLADAATAVLAVDEFLPAVGQGVIAIEARADDARTRALLAAIDHADTATALAAERAFLAVLDGSCRTPIAGHATVAAGRLQFRGLIARPDGSEALETHARGRRRRCGRARRRCRPRAQGARRRRFLRLARRRETRAAPGHPAASPTASAPPRRCARAATTCWWRRCCASSASISSSAAGRAARS